MQPDAHPTDHPTLTRRWRTLLVVPLLGATIALVACGNDDDASGAPAADTTEAPAGDEEASGADSEYCQLALEISASEEFPTVEQIDGLEATAPEEIAAEVALVAQIFRAAIEGGDFTTAFEDPVVQENFPAVEAYESQVCGTNGGEDAQDPSVTEIDPDATQVAVDATEYNFDFDPPAGGPTSFVMTNSGVEGHVMVLIQLEEGAVLDDALASEGEEGVAQEFNSDYAAPGDEVVVTADLTPGTWVLLCPVPAPDDEPHFAKGMLVEFEIS